MAKKKSARRVPVVGGMVCAWVFRDVVSAERELLKAMRAHLRNVHSASAWSRLEDAKSALRSADATLKNARARKGQQTQRLERTRRKTAAQNLREAEARERSGVLPGQTALEFAELAEKAEAVVSELQRAG
jgi:predicted small metal-binding protein